MITQAVTIKLEPRPGGGLRVYSDDIPGLMLSHPDQEAVLMDIGPAIIGALFNKFTRPGLTADAASHLLLLASEARARGDIGEAEKIEEDGRLIERVAREHGLIFDYRAPPQK